MTIQKEDLVLFKQEKQKELALVDEVFVKEQKDQIILRVHDFQESLSNDLNHETALKKAAINGEISAIDNLIKRADTPEQTQ